MKVSDSSQSPDDQPKDSVQDSSVSTAAVTVAVNRLEASEKVIKHNLAWSAGVGVLPFPVFDLVAITGVQLKMINELCEIYDQPFKQEIAKPLVTSLIGSLSAGVLGEVLAYSTAKLIPGLGHLVGAVSLSATFAGITYAVGRLFRDHFEAGGSLADFNPVSFQKLFKSKVDEGIAQAKALAPSH